MSKQKGPSQLKSLSIENENLRITVLNYGASLREIYLKKLKKNVLLDFASVKDYVKKPAPYLNAAVGPAAGRIAGGRYKMDGQEMQLSRNEGVNHLHGGRSGISKQYFELHQADKQKVICTWSGRHDEDGYKGKFNYAIEYSLKEFTLQIKAICVPEEKTALNMTQHLYFNLSGDMEESVRKAKLTLDAAATVLLHEDNCPYRIEAFESGNTELRDRVLADLLPLNTPYILRKDGKLTLTQNDIRLSVETDAPAVVLYSADDFDENLILNKNKKGYPGCALAIECQDIPNGVNIDPDTEKYFYSPERPYRQTTCFSFSKAE